MTNTTTFDRRDLIAEAIRAHGPRRVILAALRAMIHPVSKAQLNAPPMNDHIRRDIGLAREKPPPTWELLR